MAKKIKVVRTYNRKSVDDKVSLGKRVITGLTNNSKTFPNLPVPVADLTSANNTLTNTYEDYKNKGEAAKGNFQNAQYDWKQKFDKTATYVDTVADGNLAIINQSGFDASSPTVNNAELPVALNNLKSKGDQEKGNGHVVSTVDSRPGLKAYVFTLLNPEYTLESTSNQITVKKGDTVVFVINLNTKRETEFEGLTSLTKLDAQAAGFNTAGIGSFSQPVSVSVP